MFWLGMRYCRLMPACMLRENTVVCTLCFWYCQRVNGWTNSPVFEFQSRYIEHHFEARAKLPLIFDVSVCRLFVLPITTEWPSEWDMILRWPLFRRVSETTPLKKQGQERYSDRTAKRKMMSISIASIGLWPPQSQSAPWRAADWIRGTPLNTPKKDKIQERRWYFWRKKTIKKCVSKYA